MKRTAFFPIVAVLSVSLVQAAEVFVPGVLQEEYWAGKVKGDIAAGTAGTPTFIIGDAMLVGVKPLQQIESAIADARPPSARRP